MKIKNVCVLGGSGFVGKHVVHQLTAQGCEVRVLTRNRERAKELIVLPTVDVVAANIFDPVELNRQFSGMDAVINLTGILNETRSGRVDKPSARRGDFHEVHIELPRKVVHACAEKGVPRLLHMSALNADPTGPSSYLRSKGLGETIVREAGMVHQENENWYLNGPKFVHGYGLQVTIFRPSVIFGRGDKFLNTFATLLKRFPILPLASAGGRFQPVYVEDVARVFAASLTNPTTFGETYDLCGPTVYTLHELVQLVAKMLGVRRRIVPLNSMLSFVQALLLEYAPGKLMTRDNYNSMKLDAVCQCDFPSIFGFTPAALEAVVPAYLAAKNPRERYTGLRYKARR